MSVIGYLYVNNLSRTRPRKAVRSDDGYIWWVSVDDSFVDCMAGVYKTGLHSFLERYVL